MLLGWVQGMRPGEYSRRGANPSELVKPSVYMSIITFQSPNINRPFSIKHPFWVLRLQRPEQILSLSFFYGCLHKCIHWIPFFSLSPFLADSMVSTQSSSFCFSNSYLLLKVVMAALVFADE